MNDLVYEALLAGARHKKELERKGKVLEQKLEVFIKSYIRYKNTPVNLPRYKCRCMRLSYLDCPFCDNKYSLSYDEALELWNVDTLPLGLQVPQCHICTRFETDDNPLFAYSYFERNGDFKFIYRCLKGHGYDHGMVLFDNQTGMEVHI